MFKYLLLVVKDSEEAVISLTVFGSVCVPPFQKAILTNRHASATEADEHHEFDLFRAQVTRVIELYVLGALFVVSH